MKVVPALLRIPIIFSIYDNIDMSFSLTEREVKIPY